MLMHPVVAICACLLAIGRSCLAAATLAAPAIVSALAPSLAVAQAWPARPVSIIVPFAPGGISDITARPLAVALGRVLGQSVVVDNKPGAGGAVGAAYAARQKADGYALMMALSSLVVIPEAERVAGRAPSYQLSQFTPIARVAADPVVVMVRADSPWRTLDDLLAEARRSPGTLSYSSSGIYGALHVPMEMLAQSAGVRFLHVPYQSGGQAMTALLSGQVAITAQAPGVAFPHLKAGKVRILASFGTERIKGLPEVPTFRELGYDCEFFIWSALFAPVDTPPELVARLRVATREAIREPVFAEAMAAMASPIDYLDAPELAVSMERERKRLADTVQRMGRIE
jgi:tripartite-type tricarboxylate transporter receptor subunit TctC